AVAHRHAHRATLAGDGAAAADQIGAQPPALDRHDLRLYRRDHGDRCGAHGARLRPAEDYVDCRRPFGRYRVWAAVHRVEFRICYSYLKLLVKLRPCRIYVAQTSCLEVSMGSHSGGMS